MDWSSGKDVLGFGSIRKAKLNTEVGKKSASGTNALTCYFRKRFRVDNTSSVSKVTASVLMDDGAVIYLNGQEVYRSNLSAGAVEYSDKALKSITGRFESNYTNFIIDSSCLEEGFNVLAVEVHQSNMTSSDLGFDMNVAVSRVAE